MFSTLQLEDLPNELIHRVFRFLNIVELLKCAEVSKRFYAISNDDQYLWPKKLNLCYKKVPVEFLQRLLDSGCKYLSLSGAVLQGTPNFPTTSVLKYLNLAGFGLKNNPEKILKSCFSLQKLSLSQLPLSLKLISITSLQNSKTLKVLDLSRCTFLGSHSNELDCIEQIVETCTELKELSLCMTYLCETSIDFLVSNLTSQIEKLDLFNMDCLTDNHVKKLVTRCNKITELNLGGWNSTTRQSLSFIIENLKLTLVKLSYVSSYVKFNPSDLFKLKTMEKLKVLFYDGLMENWYDIDWIKQHLPNLRIKVNPGYRSIAMPCQPEYNHQGFWDIKVQQEELFNNAYPKALSK